MATPAEVGIFTTDESLVIRTWDNWLAAVTGTSAEEVVGRLVTDVVPDLESRGHLRRLRDVLSTGAVQVLSPALHHFLIPCPPRHSSTEFDHMQQRVTMGPLREGEAIVGVVVAIEDVTARLESERALAHALTSEDWQARHAAVEELSRNADEGFVLALLDNVRQDHRNFNILSSALKLLQTTDVDVTAPLAALLREQDADLRIQAALALGDQHHPAAVDALLTALHDDDANVRFQAIESLGRLRAEAAVDHLLAIVSSRDFFLAFAALDALTAINEPRIAADLVPLLADEQLRVPVADALGVLGDDRAVRPLVESLAVAPQATQAIAEAIVRIHDRYERDYGDGARISDFVQQGISSEGRRHVVGAIATASGEPLRALVRMLGWFNGDQVERTLARLLSQPEVRAEVIEALVRHGDRVVDLLLEELAAAPDDETRHAAIVALGRVGSRRATGPLSALLDEGGDLLVAVAGALSRIGDRAAFEPLLGLLSHTNAAVRQAAIGALNSIGHPDLPARVGVLLEDAEALVRESAVRIAGYFGYPETTDRLFARVRDEHELVRRAALEHLPYVDDPRVTPTLEAALAADTPAARAAAARALGRVDGPAASIALIRALEDGDLWVRYYAARSLAEHRHPGAVPHLLRHAASDAAPQVRIASIDALGTMRDASVIPTLQQLAEDQHSDVAAAALNALGHVAAADGLPQLQHALRSDDSPRRLAAIAGLAANGSAEAVMSLEWASGADSDAAIARAAVEALGTIAASDTPAAVSAIEALVALLADSARRDYAAFTLSQLPPVTIANVAAGLEHPLPDVRRATVEVLGRFHHPEASRLIRAALNDTSATVREAAVIALTRLGARGAEHRIAELAATDPSKAVRRAATTALAHNRAAGMSE